MRKEDIRIVFMGTPEFAVNVLQGLIDNYKDNIIGVVSQPDRKVGRHQELKNTPVKDLALKYNIPVLPLVISYRKPTGIYKLLKIKQPLITINIGQPIFPDKNLSKKENINNIRKEAFKQMVEMAGIEQNMWQPEAD